MMSSRPVSPFDAARSQTDNQPALRRFSMGPRYVIAPPVNEDRYVQNLQSDPFYHGGHLRPLVKPFWVAQICCDTDPLRCGPDQTPQMHRLLMDAQAGMQAYISQRFAGKGKMTAFAEKLRSRYQKDVAGLEYLASQIKWLERQASCEGNPLRPRLSTCTQRLETAPVPASVGGIIAAISAEIRRLDAIDKVLRQVVNNGWSTNKETKQMVETGRAYIKDFKSRFASFEDQVLKLRLR